MASESQSSYEISGGTSSVEQVAHDADSLRQAARDWVAAYLQEHPLGPGETLAGARLAARELPALTAELSQRYSDLLKAYPLTFRFIVALDRYNPVVFRRYLKSLRGQDWSRREDWLESQADYATQLYRNERPRASVQEVADYCRRTVESLKDEDSDFKEAAEFAKEEAEALRLRAHAQRRARLMEYALQARAEAVGVEVGALTAALGAQRAAKEADEDPLHFGAALLVDQPGALAALRAICQAPADE